MRVDQNEGKYGRFYIEDFKEFNEYDGIIISDYNKGFLSEKDIENISNHHNLVVIDTKKPLDKFVENCAYIKVNSNEYKKAKNITNKMKEKLIITLGGNGTWYNNKLFNVPNVDIKNLSGAGDSFISGFIVELIKTNDVDKAINFANKVATAVVQKKGVSTVNIRDLEDLELLDEYFIDHKCTEEELKIIMDQ